MGNICCCCNEEGSQLLLETSTEHLLPSSNYGYAEDVGTVITDPPRARNNSITSRQSNRRTSDLGFKRNTSTTSSRISTISRIVDSRDGRNSAFPSYPRPSKTNKPPAETLSDAARRLSFNVSKKDSEVNEKSSKHATISKQPSIKKVIPPRPSLNQDIKVPGKSSRDAVASHQPTLNIKNVPRAIILNIKKNPNILNELFMASDFSETSKVRDIKNTYKETLTPDSWEFKEVKKKFANTNKSCFKIYTIEKVYNPYLMMQYGLRKTEFIKKGISYEEEIMFHGTKKSNVDSICTNNFNWRLAGSSRGYQHGRGVCFSPFSFYATHYGDNQYNKVMIAASVLISNCCSGSYKTVVPPLGYDTTISEKKDVYVKYDDNTFYPAYVIHYGGIYEEDTKENTETETSQPNKQLDKDNLSKRRKDVMADFQKLIITESLIFRRQKVTKNPELLTQLSNASNVEKFTNIPDTDGTYTLKRLDFNSREYKLVVGKFFNTTRNKPYFKIHSIEKVYNRCLLIQYALKISEYRKKGINFKQMMMFHGTKKSNIDDICESNFNWRYKGTARGVKFGQGVSFSPIAYYSTHYGDTGYNKVMILSLVIVGEECIGNRNMSVPPVGYDTSTNPKRHVYVKYDDNTFYPAYLIHYGDSSYRNQGYNTDEEL